MARLVFGFKLEGDAGVAPSVRMWVDVDGNQQLDDGEEVQPLLREGQQWYGSYPVVESAVDGTSFVVQFAAQPGARWALEVALDGDPPRQVYSDGDRVARSEQRIIGRCRL
jgi:hypothetical protein